LLLLFANTIFGQLPNKISKEEKIYGLSKFWQEVNYNFVYFNKVNKDEWNNRYKKLLLEVQETPNDYEYYRLLQKFCAYLKDGHTNVWFPKEIQDSIFNSDFGDYKLILTNIDGKAVITQVNVSKKKEIPIGSEITQVNGISTDKYINENVRPYISSSTEHLLADLSIKYMLEGLAGATFDLELKLPNGKVKSLKLRHSITKEKELYPPDKTEVLDFKWVKNDIAYLALNSFSEWDIMDSFSLKLPEIRKSKKLIIDLRKNTGGDSRVGREIIKYLTNDTILYGSKTQSRLHIPSYKAWGKWTKAKDTINNEWSKQSYLSYRDEYYFDFPYNPYPTMNMDIDRMEVPTALLIGHNTASAAEDFLVYADNQENMVKIGEPTFGSTGQPLMFELPNGGTGRVCTKKDTYPDGREFVGYGIQPDIKVKKTFSDYLENKDPVLEKAIEYLENKK
jgi:C-terminal processing protease CtpA/Prc